MTDRGRLAAGFGIPPATMIVVWSLVSAMGLRPADLSQAATWPGGLAMSVVAGAFNLLPFWLYARFRASRSGLPADRIDALRRTRTGLLAGAMAFCAVNTVSHAAIWWDHFTLPRIDAQEGLAYILVWAFSLLALHAGYGVGVLLARGPGRFEE